MTGAWGLLSGAIRDALELDMSSFTERDEEGGVFSVEI